MWEIRRLTWAAILAVAWAGVSFAQDPVLTRLYGSGVHAFFAGKYAKAHEYLTKAIDMGLEDPRAYYFRGLAYLKLGRPEEAEDDFRKGAEIEARDIGLVYDVGRSLERIQGRARLLLERHRFTARMAAVERAEKIRRERYGEQRARQREFILEQAKPAEASPLPPASAQTPVQVPSPVAIPLPPPVTPTTERGPEPLPPLPQGQPEQGAPSPVTMPPAGQAEPQPAAVPAAPAQPPSTPPQWPPPAPQLPEALPPLPPGEN
ncbi:MAG: tetratricopeptide repeat protein [Thermoguttaceae bacterium]|nr:tetratricopeptide repeat protein [Thermoguttaceae bacterium]